MHVMTIFIWFMLYSVMGWIYETIFCSVKSLKWDNRGMLIGPYCPIYGVGAVLDVLLCSGLPNYGAVFLACVLGSAVLEFTTSYATEKLFHAVWWDYSRLPLNIQGRICLQCSLGFGVAGLIVLYGIHPFMSRITDAIPLFWQEPAALFLMAVFAVDCALTADSLVALNVKLETTMKAIDSQISEKYAAFIETSRQNLSEGLVVLKEKISLEEFREHRMMEELKNTLSTMNWSQIRALRSLVSIRHANYGELADKMKQTVLFLKKRRDKEERDLP